MGDGEGVASLPGAAPARMGHADSTGLAEGRGAEGVFPGVSRALRGPPPTRRHGWFRSSGTGRAESKVPGRPSLH